MTDPVLTVRTERLENAGSLIEWSDPLHPIAFLRGGDGIVGWGTRTVFIGTSSERLHRLAEWWTELRERATIEDEVGLPGTGLVAFGSFAFADSTGDPGTLIVPNVVVGRRNGVSWITRIDHADAVQPRALGAAPSDQLGPGSNSAFVPGAMSPERYRSTVATATRALEAGRAEKVVIARDLVASIPAMTDRRVLVDRLATAYPDTFAFAVAGLIGASPETLVRVTRGQVSARVLAGTAARGVDAAADALAETAIAASPKDLAEHEFALRSVLDSLEPHTSSLGASTEPFALRLPNLFHLASDVTGTLAEGSSVLELVAALHPTAAVAGTPTAAALELIAELEPFDRGRYAGPVGWLDAQGNGEWAIALRCARIDEHGAVTAWAGAGIVADSDPDRELAETELKFRPIIDAFS